MTRTRIAQMLAAGALVCACLYGQSTTGTILGTVADPGDAPVAGARVELVNASTGAVTTTTTGILRRVAPNQLVIQPDDHRVIWYRLAPRLIVQKEGKDADLKDFALGDFLSVDSTSDDDSIMTAVSVTWKKAGTPEDRAEAAKEWDLPRLETVARAAAPTSSSASSPPREPGDERPVLRRKNPDPQPEAPPPAVAPAKEESKDAPKEVAEVDNTPPATVLKQPDAKPDADDPGKPVLRRGTPAPRRQTAEESPIQHETPPTPAAKAPVPEVLTGTPPQPATQVIVFQDDPVIVKAREAATSY